MPLGKLDKFGTGNAMSYARKYAFLNALNLRTALDNDDGQDAVVVGWGSRTGGNVFSGEGAGYLDYNHLLIENNAIKEFTIPQTRN